MHPGRSMWQYNCLDWYYLVTDERRVIVRCYCQCLLRPYKVALLLHRSSQADKGALFVGVFYAVMSYAMP
jgi:hypothetical protein